MGATWSEPTGAAPANNTDAPLNVGTTDQVKNGGLSVDSLAVFGEVAITGTTSAQQINAAAYCDFTGGNCFSGAGGGDPSISLLAYREPSGVSSPSYTGMGWVPVNFNTEISDSAAKVTLAAGGQFTLAQSAVVDWQVSARTRGSFHGATRLRDVNSGAVIEYGSTVFAGLENWDDTTVIMPGSTVLSPGTYVVEIFNKGNSDSSITAASVGAYEQYAIMKVF